MIRDTNKSSLVEDLNRMIGVYVLSGVLENGTFSTVWRNDMFHDFLSLMVYHQIAYRINTSACGKHHTLVDKIIKAVTIVTVGKYLNGNTEDLGKILTMTIVGTVIYVILLKQPLTSLIRSSFPKFVDPDCIEDWTENFILMSLNNDFSRGNMITGIMWKFVATGIYYHLVKPLT